MYFKSLGTALEGRGRIKERRKEGGREEGKKGKGGREGERKGRRRGGGGREGGRAINWTRHMQYTCALTGEEIGRAHV